MQLIRIKHQIFLKTKQKIIKYERFNSQHHGVVVAAATLKSVDLRVYLHSRDPPKNYENGIYRFSAGQLAQN